MRVSQILVSLLAVVGVLVTQGCGSRQRESPALVPFSGTVTVDDKPANLAMVKLLPVGDTKGFGGFGITNKDGKVMIKPNGVPGDGVPPGTYKVLVTTFFLGEGYDPSSPDNPPGMKPLTPEQGTPTEIPVIFGNEENTPLSVTVGTAGGTESFALRSK